MGDQAAHNPRKREPIDRIRDAVAVINSTYPLPWRVTLRSYDHEEVLASGNVVVAGVCVGLREPTNVVLHLEAPEVVTMPEPPAEVVVEPKWWHPTPWRWGFLHGVMVGAIIAICAIGVGR